MPKNERKFARFPMSGLVVIRVPGQNIQCSGTIEMIALRGVGVYTREKIPAGTPVQVEIISFVGGGSSNYVLTGVIRNHDRHNEFGVLGVEFDNEISSADQPKLYEYLMSQFNKLTEYNNR